MGIVGSLNSQFLFLLLKAVFLRTFSVFMKRRQKGKGL